MLEETLTGGGLGAGTGGGVKVESKKPVVKDEATRLRELRDRQLAERNESNRTQPGAGAYDGLSVPEETAEQGKPVVAKLAEKGKLPAKEIPPGAPL